ncbi:Vanillyl-alcohol oxidase [Cyphellophora attinorum]|uniref:Vanillyl-alcohol oxidase n=1 Tax=Cyphellophora attinorum TaxID=1664694 RepID=A0A0N1HIF3_9EURO|nr:Vanillyl-alcohol oxidase [Phialophora attinorum]KPI46104.1 Vanillyl-alcohol oxidase [Phialophora attinorum]
MPGADGADNDCWQSFQAAYGPYVDGIFSQSNYGIVTKMGFWLMPETDHQSYMITFPRDSDLGRIVEIIKPLAQKRILGNIPQLRHVIQELAVTGKPRSHWYTGTGTMPRDVIAKHAATQPCGDVAWCFYGTQYGDRASINSQIALLKTEFAAVPGMKFYLPEDMPADHYLHSRALVCSGTPVLKELDWLNWTPNAAHLFFSPILPTRARDAEKAFEIITRLHKKYGFDLLPTCCIAGREMHTIVNIVYDRYDADAKRRAMGCMREMIRECAKQGYGEYRTHLLFQDQVAESYSWGGGALRKFNETIKDALDPNSIMSLAGMAFGGRGLGGKGGRYWMEISGTYSETAKKKQEESRAKGDYLYIARQVKIEENAKNPLQ